MRSGLICSFGSELLSSACCSMCPSQDVWFCDNLSANDDSGLDIRQIAKPCIEISGFFSIELR
jgi:hypothetical protein